MPGQNESDRTIVDEMNAIMAEGRQSFPNGSRVKIGGLDSFALYFYYELLHNGLTLSSDMNCQQLV